ncbi:MAG: hypothetical protein DRR03_06845 [Gammaproteobacteria bacterium]|nr:MAG: hypothetical protein DRR03_06845 [Gammaproteobacteria bacterium]
MAVDRFGDLRMDEELQNGMRREIDGKPRIFYEGYWVRCYKPPSGSLEEKKKLIERLTRRAFHHTEQGINTPGNCLSLARAAYEAETDPTRKRVNAAMLAGALFNRATDIFTSIVDLEHRGIAIGPDNELMKQCGDCFQEALDLGEQVKHFSGEEGVDELWGEPMKAFLMPIGDFYETRYIKIAWAMRDIERISEVMINLAETFEFKGFVQMITAYNAICLQVCDTAKYDPDNFQIWPCYVATHEALAELCARRASDSDLTLRMLVDDAYRVQWAGMDLISYLAGTRVPMAKSLQNFLDKCESIHLRKRMLEGYSAATG